MSELCGTGFAPPRTARVRSRRRAAAIELIATFSLTLSLVVAVAAISIGNRSLLRDDPGSRATAHTPVGSWFDHAAVWFAVGARD